MGNAVAGGPHSLPSQEDAILHGKTATIQFRKIPRVARPVKDWPAGYAWFDGYFVRNL
jgi:hypothetical protein